MLSDTSPPKLSTLPSRINSSECLVTPRIGTATGSGSPVTWLVEVLLVLPLLPLSILSIMPVLVWPRICCHPKKKEEKVNSTGKESSPFFFSFIFQLLMVRNNLRLFDVYKKTLASDGIVGLYRGFNISCVGIIVYRGLYFGMYDSLKPVLL